MSKIETRFVTDPHEASRMMNAGWIPMQESLNERFAEGVFLMTGPNYKPEPKPRVGQPVDPDDVRFGDVWVRDVPQRYRDWFWPVAHCGDRLFAGVGRSDSWHGAGEPYQPAFQTSTAGWELANEARPLPAPFDWNNRSLGEIIPLPGVERPKSRVGVSPLLSVRPGDVIALDGTVILVERFQQPTGSHPLEITGTQARTVHVWNKAPQTPACILAESASIDDFLALAKKELKLDA